eukprot:m.150218 g.150218  ORF g.150218 m.150218 type:complete len:278 (-) comp16312_c0_seq2:1705-2538(-)
MADLDALLGDALVDFDTQDAVASSQVPQGPEAAVSTDPELDDVDILADQLADEFLEGLQMASDSTEVNGLVESLMAQLSQSQSQSSTSEAASATHAAKPAPQPKPSQASQSADMEQEFERLLKNLGEQTGEPDLQRLLEGLLVDAASQQDTPAPDQQPSEGEEEDPRILQALLSKELMYPSLKQLQTLYPSWLESNSADLSPQERERYNKQYDIIKQICSCYEESTATPAAVQALISQMSECGPPPTALVEEMGVQVDEQGRPQLPFAQLGDPCNQM